MNSIEELKEIKRKKEALVADRNANGIPTVNVHMGTCGTAAGSTDVLNAVIEEVKTRNLEKIYVMQSGCPGVCINEPMLTLTIPGEVPYIYIKVTPENAKEIISRHVIDNQPIPEWLLNLKK
ncbi:MAG: (2Fe-2S) ferredoxin domain-containing protein [Clostridiales bacterium]|nr:(2Fe-2S) ferredoxin domain-containing protein [Clostridiales bacterium]